MLANQLIGTAYGSWKEGFNGGLLWAGILKIVYLGIGYGALAFAAHYASQYIPPAEYLSGILIEPIAKYFSKICDSLRHLLDDSVSETLTQKKNKSANFLKEADTSLQESASLAETDTKIGA